MTQGKGSHRRPMFIDSPVFARKWHETFGEHERRIANDPKEHGRRLRRSAMLQRPIDGSKTYDEQRAG